MTQHRALRAAVFGLLEAAAGRPAPVFSQPLPGQPYPVIIIEQVVLDELVDKDGQDGWYLVTIQSAVRGFSPEVLDTQSDWVSGVVKDAALAASGFYFSPPILDDEADDAILDAPGGPIYVRNQQFRIFVGAAD